MNGTIAATASAEVAISHDVVLCPRANIAETPTVTAAAFIDSCQVCKDKVLVAGFIQKTIEYVPLDVTGCDSITNVKIVPFLACIPVKHVLPDDDCEALASVECQIDEFRLGGRVFHFEACVRVNIAVFDDAGASLFESIS